MTVKKRGRPARNTVRRCTLTLRADIAEMLKEWSATLQTDMGTALCVILDALEDDIAKLAIEEADDVASPGTAAEPTLPEVRETVEVEVDTCPECEAELPPMPGVGQWWACEECGRWEYCVTPGDVETAATTP